MPRGWKRTWGFECVLGSYKGESIAVGAGGDPSWERRWGTCNLPVVSPDEEVHIPYQLVFHIRASFTRVVSFM